MSDSGPRRARRGYTAAQADADVTPRSAPGPSNLPPSRRFAGRSQARHGQLPVTTPARSLSKFFAITAIVALFSVIGIGAAAYIKLTGSLNSFDLGPEAENPPTNLAQLEGGANIMIVGSDDRTGQGEEFNEGEADAEGVLNDVNMLVHVSEDQSHITVVSIPRDTIISTPACVDTSGNVLMDELYGMPFNSILGQGGMECVVQAAEHLSGLDIQYAGMVKFRGVIALSNAIGGVKVCVANDIDDDYIGLQLSAGEHVIQGEDALKFLRTRHGVGDGSDLSRISNQQLFLSAMLQQIKSTDTLTNPAKLYGLATAVTQNMELSSTLNNMDTLIAMANAVSKVPLEQINFVQIPTTGSYDFPGKVEPLEPDNDQMWEYLRNDQPIGVYGPKPTVEAQDPEGDSAEPTPSESSDGDGTGAPVDTAAPTPAPTVHGQTADQAACANA